MFRNLTSYSELRGEKQCWGVYLILDRIKRIFKPQQIKPDAIVDIPKICLLLYNIH